MRTIGPWRPSDEYYFQQSVPIATWDKRVRDASDLILSLIRQLAPWKEAVDAVAKQAPEVISVTEAMWHAGRSNPLTSRPTNGVTNWPADGYTTTGIPIGLPLPYFVDPALASTFSKTADKSLAAMRRYRVVRREPSVPGAPTPGYTIIDLQAGPTGSAVKTSGSAGIGLTDTRIVVPLSSGTVVSSGGSGASPPTVSPAAPISPPSMSSRSFPYLIGGALVLGLGYILTRRSPSR